MTKRTNVFVFNNSLITNDAVLNVVLGNVPKLKTSTNTKSMVNSGININ